MTKTLHGKPVAETILKSLRDADTANARLAIVLVGENPVSERYIAAKQKTCTSVGIESELLSFPEDIAQEQLEEAVAALAVDAHFSGIIVQLPLPAHLDAQRILDRIPLEKDVDLLSSAAYGRFALGISEIEPPTVSAVMALLGHYDISHKEKSILVLGTGRLVGMPLIVKLSREPVSLSVANKHTKNIEELVRQADIVISGVGKPNLITGDILKEGAVVIDAGTSVEDGVAKGDVDAESVGEIASALSPVPGGIGPVTTAFLLKNLVTLSE